MQVTKYSLAHHYFVQYGYVSSTQEAVGIIAASWLCLLVSQQQREYSMSAIAAAVSTRREYCSGCSVNQERGCVQLCGVMSCLLLRLLCQPEEDKCVCSSCISS